MSKAFHKFIGTTRWLALLAAWRDSSARIVCEPFSNVLVLIALLVSLIPVLSLYLDAQGIGLPAYYPTLAFSFCTILGFFIRYRFGVKRSAFKLSLRDLSLTHTAVALGCIPAVFIVLIEPDLLANRAEILNELMPRVAPESSAGLGIVWTICIIVSLSAWVAITEEVVFRGVLLSLIRRIGIAKGQLHRDTLAVLLSALVFGLAHYPSWGLLPALALSGLGIGFGIAYVVCNEKLLPVVGYHFLFDFVSMSIALF